MVWLHRELQACDPDKTMVVTHHAPHRQSVQPRHENDILKAAYASDLEHLMGRSKLWAHGHMHNNSDYIISGTRVICNPRGYMIRDGSMENDGFNPVCVVEV